MLVPPFAWGRYYHKMLSHYILWLLTLVPEGPYLSINAVTQPMMVKEGEIPYGDQEK